MPAELQEKTPGVYVRAENEPHELDVLWSQSRPYAREERSPLLSFIAGLLVGAALTAAVFLLFINKPNIQAGENEMLAPIAAEEASKAPANSSGAASSGTTGPSAKTVTPAASTTYTVVNGDTLGRISEKVYGTSAPQYLEKIQRANNMSSPDNLQIDQKLIIPPKDY